MDKDITGIKTEYFYSEQIYLILSRKLFASLGMDKITLMRQLDHGDFTALANCPFVMCSPEDIVGEMERDLLKNSGIQPLIKATSDNIETLLTLCNMSVGACLCPDKLFEIAFSEDEYEQLEVFPLGEKASYPIQFSYRTDNYQWKVISEFINTASVKLGGEDAFDGQKK